MSFIEANITVDLQDSENYEVLVNQIKQLISDINGKDTDVNIIEIDDPISNNPIYYKRGD